MSRAGSLCRDPGTLVKRNKNQFCDYISWDPSIQCYAGIPGGSLLSNHGCRATRRMNQARNRTAGNTLFMGIDCWLMWSVPYCELYCHAVCTWKLWNLPRSWFVYGRIQLNLIDLRVLKIERSLHVKMLDRERKQLVYEVILLNKIWKNHLLSENMPWNYASFNVTLNHLMHEIMEFCVTFFLTLDNWEPKYCQTLGNEPNHLHRVLWGRLFSKGKIKLFNSLFQSVFPVFRKRFFSIADLFPMSYLWFICNEDKCCVETQCAADFRVAWLVYVRTYCVPIGTLNQNKRSQFLYLGDAQINTRDSYACLNQVSAKGAFLTEASRGAEFRRSTVQ